MAINTKGGRRRERRRKKRQDKKVEKPTFYGGSKEAEERYRKKSDEAVDEAAGSRRGETGDLQAVEDRAAKLESSSASDYNRSKLDSQGSRSAYQNSILGIRGGADEAAMLRNNALAANDMRGAADTAIAQNAALASQQLQRNIGLANRAAMGLAAGQGEGGALAMQQAIASAGQGAMDAGQASNLQQAQLANDMRYAAAQQQAANALGVADANAAGVYDAGLQTTNAQAGLMTADQAAQQAANARQQNFLAQRASIAGGGVDAALTDQGQQLQNQQVVNTSQLAADQRAAQAAAEGARRNTLVNRISRVAAPWNNKE